jgi:hypothetical protein
MKFRLFRKSWTGGPAGVADFPLLSSTLRKKRRNESSRDELRSCDWGVLNFLLGRARERACLLVSRIASRGS